MTRTHAHKKPAPGLQIDALDKTDEILVNACVAMLEKAFNNPSTYAPARLRSELTTSDTTFYREFFVASIEGEVVGFGGIKAADWASHTHLLYLSAVVAEHRGRGIARALLQFRLSWLESHFAFGRVLVSSKRAKRFVEMGFKEIVQDDLDGRRLYLKTLKEKPGSRPG